MGLDVHHDVYRQQRRDQKAATRIERNIEKANRFKIGERHGRIALLGNMLAGKDATLEEKQMLGEYADAYMVGRQRKLGCTPLLAWIALKGQNRDGLSVKESATQLYRYRLRLTKDERHYHDDPGKSPVITSETFQHALNANPQQVLEDAENWAKTYSDCFIQREADFADYALTAELVPPSDSPS